MPAGDFYKQSRVFLYEVAPAQTTPEAMTRLAELQMADNHPDSAAGLLHAALQRDPDSLPALIALARLQLTTNQITDFTATLLRIHELLPAAGPLELEDRSDLAALFSHTSDTATTLQQLQLALRDANSHTLRKVRVDSLFTLLYLARTHGLLDTRPGFWGFGLSLLPPAAQMQLLALSSDFEKSVGHAPAAASLLQQALLFDPDSLPVLQRLALLLATSTDPAVRNGPQALTLAEHAFELDQGKHVDVTDALACAAAETGDFARAVPLEQAAVAAAEQANAATLRAHLAQFQNRQPVHE